MEITKEHKHFKELRALVACVSKKPNRPSLNFVYADNESVVATNGHILTRLVRPADFDPGHYRVIRSNAKSVYLERLPDQEARAYKYPDYKSVLPVNCDLLGKLSDNLSMAHAKISQAGICLDIDYLKILVGFDMKWGLTGPSNAVYFKNGVLDAAIMPIRM